MAAINDISLEALQAASVANAGEANEALSRGLDGEFSMQADKGEAFEREKLTGPGLVFALNIGDEGVFLFMPLAEGAVPEWSKSPDPTGESKLATLAQELSMLVLPEDVLVDDFKAKFVESTEASVEAGSLANDCNLLALPLKEAEGTNLYIAWPLTAATNTFPVEQPEASKPTDSPSEKDSQQTASQQRSDGAPPSNNDNFSELPHYAKTLLRVPVPAIVHLARKKMPVRDILGLAPGSIIKFEKSCDESLELVIGDTPVAEGDAVKVGERFGLRLTRMIMPEERFYSARG